MMVEPAWGPRMLLLLILLLLSVAGLVLLIRGLRGRWVGDHPHCRRCGFDLFGTPEAAVCNECGADLSRRKATQIGQRRRRPAMALVGLFLLLPGLGVLGIAGYGVATNIDWQPYKPGWWLVRELASSNVQTRDAAVAELEKRLLADELSDANVNEVVEWVLARQVNWPGPWDSRWGDLVEQARGKGKASDAQWKQFAEQGIIPTLVARPSIRAGDPLPMTLRWQSRLGPSQRWLAYGTVEQLTVAGVLLEDFGRAAGGISLQNTGWSFTFHSPRVDEEATRDLPVGQGQTTMRLNMQITQWEPGMPTDSPDGPLETPLVEKALELSAPLTVRPAGDDPRWLTTDSKVREAVRAAVFVTPLARKPGRVMAQSRNKDWPWELALVSRDPNLRLGHRVFVIIDSEVFEAEEGNWSSSTSDAQGYIGHEGIDVPELPKTIEGQWPKSATVVILPDLEKAKNDTDATPYWGEVTVFRNVPLATSEYPIRPGEFGPKPIPHIGVTEFLPFDPSIGIPPELLDEAPPTTQPATRPATQSVAP